MPWAFHTCVFCNPLRTETKGKSFLVTKGVGGRKVPMMIHILRHELRCRAINPTGLGMLRFVLGTHTTIATVLSTYPGSLTESQKYGIWQVNRCHKTLRKWRRGLVRNFGPFQVDFEGVARWVGHHPLCNPHHRPNVLWGVGRHAPRFINQSACQKDLAGTGWELVWSWLGVGWLGFG